MKIGIEVELHSNNGLSSYDILNDNDFSYTSFKLIEGTTIGVKMSEEYYEDTIEYNFTPFDVTKENFAIVKEFLEEQMRKYGLILNAGAPKFVGTHVHIFSEAYLSLSHPKLLKRVCRFMVENFSCLSDASINRIMTGHQLWTNWSHKNAHKWVNALREYGIRPQYYDSHQNTPKYNPIINSKATRAGKPVSLEIRLFPNEFMFNGKVFEMMKMIEENTFFDTKEMKVVDFLHACGTKLGMRRNEREPVVTERNGLISVHDYFSGSSSSIPMPEVNTLSNNEIANQFVSPNYINEREYSLGMYESKVVIFRYGSADRIINSDLVGRDSIAYDLYHLKSEWKNYVANVLRRQSNRTESFIDMMMIGTIIDEENTLSNNDLINQLTTGGIRLDASYTLGTHETRQNSDGTWNVRRSLNNVNNVVINDPPF